jgi:hypothetical protein
MTDAEIKALANAAAEAAVNKVLLRIGIDPEDENAIPSLKSDLGYLKRLHAGSETFKRQGITATATVITTFIIGSIVAAAFKYWPFPTH